MKNSTSYIKLTSAMLIFGTVGIVVRNIALPSGFVAMSRGFIGAFVIFAFMLVFRRLPSLVAIKRNLLPLIFSGAFIGINWMLLFESYSYTTVATATLCYYMAPIFVIVASPIFLSASVGAVRWVSVAVAFIGMALVSEPWTAISAGDNEFVGIILALGAAVFYAGVTVLNKKMMDISSLDTTLVQLLIAAAVITPYSIFAEDIASSTFDPWSVLLVFVLGFIHTGAAYLMYFGSMSGLSAATVSIFSYIDPIVAVALSAIVLSEPMSTVAVVGAALILLSTFISEIFGDKNVITDS